MINELIFGKEIGMWRGALVTVCFLDNSLKACGPCGASHHSVCTINNTDCYQDSHYTNTYIIQHFTCLMSDLLIYLKQKKK